MYRSKSSGSTRELKNVDVASFENKICIDTVDEVLTEILEKFSNVNETEISTDFLDYEETTQISSENSGMFTFKKISVVLLHS